MLTRMLPRLSEHVAIGGVDAQELRSYRALLDDAVLVAIKMLRDQGMPWAAIGRELGVSAQAAYQRWQRAAGREVRS